MASGCGEAMWSAFRRHCEDVLSPRLVVTLGVGYPPTTILFGARPERSVALRLPSALGL